MKKAKGMAKEKSRDLPLSLRKRPRRHPQDSPEMARHMTLICEPTLIRYRRKAPVPPILTDQLLRSIHAQSDQVIVRGVSRRRLELPRKMKRTQSRSFCKFIER